MYRTLNQYIKETYGHKMRKIALYTSNTCPNRDGLLSVEGCYFCNIQSFNPVMAQGQTLPIREQIENWIKQHPGAPAIAYFQSYSNTYGPLDELERMYHLVLEYPAIKILAIATRPDCMDDPVLNLLNCLQKKIPLWLELGLQIADDDILKAINRGHTVSDFRNACHRVMAINPAIRVSAHLILGLPGETDDHLKRTATLLRECQIRGIKIHPLAIVRHTRFAQWHQSGKLIPISMEEYIRRAALLIYLLPDEMVIERISEDSRDLLIAPPWVNQKHLLQKRINEQLDILSTHKSTETP